MKLPTLHEGLNRVQLDKIIASIKPMLSEKPFAKAIWYEMDRFGYIGTGIFKQISGEMGRRSGKRKQQWVGQRPHVRLPYQYRVGEAVKSAKRMYDSSLVSSPDINDVDQFYYVDAAAEKFGVKPDEVLKAMR